MMMTPSPSFGTPATEPNRPAPALRRGAFLCFSLAVSGTKSLPRAIREGENPLSNAEHPAASGLRQGSTVPPILPPSPLRFAPLRRQQNRHPHRDRKSTRLKLQSLMRISYAVFCLKTKQQLISLKERQTT